MLPPSIDRLRRTRRWLLPAALLAFTPKCFLCLGAYAGIGAAVFGGREMCGRSPGATEFWIRLLLGLIALFAVGRMIHSR